MQVPNAKLILIFGILSIVTCCCCNGIIGIVLAIIAIILAAKSKKEFQNNSDLYDEKTFSKVKTGRTCAIIGIILSIVVIIITLAIGTPDFDMLEMTEGSWNQLGY